MTTQTLMVGDTTGSSTDRMSVELGGNTDALRDTDTLLYSVGSFAGVRVESWELSPLEEPFITPVRAVVERIQQNTLMPSSATLALARRARENLAARRDEDIEAWADRIAGDVAGAGD